MYVSGVRKEVHILQSNRKYTFYKVAIQARATSGAPCPKYDRHLLS